MLKTKVHIEKPTYLGNRQRYLTVIIEKLMFMLDLSSWMSVNDVCMSPPSISTIFKEIKIQLLSTFFYFLNKSITWKVRISGKKLNANTSILIQSLTLCLNRSWRKGIQKFLKWRTPSVCSKLIIPFILNRADQCKKTEKKSLSNFLFFPS